MFDVFLDSSQGQRLFLQKSREDCHWVVLCYWEFLGFIGQERLTSLFEAKRPNVSLFLFCENVVFLSKIIARNGENEQKSDFFHFF